MTLSTPPPPLEHFRVEPARNGLIHLVFDVPGRTMNVFSNAAILELGQFAQWLAQADVRGTVVRSGKANAFCAGADLDELGVAYEMILAAPARDRFNVAFDHFFSLSRAMRALETAGKPVAAAIAGLALGGGCELALACHHRVLVDDPKVAMGLPESLVGLLPGSGGTQRLPRRVGVEAALPILLDGARLAGAAALEAGLVDELSTPGEEIAAAERWLLSDAATSDQPWDKADYLPPPFADFVKVIAEERRKVLAQTLGHYPAPLAILDCVEQGLPQSFDAAIRTEMSIFAHLIQRREPRDMIQTLFSGKLDYDRAMRKGGLSPAVSEAISTLKAVTANQVAGSEALAAAGFPGHRSAPAPVRTQTTAGYWLDSSPDPRAAQARAAMTCFTEAAATLASGLTREEQRVVDYALVSAGDYPAYLGGPFAQVSR